jgi:hypothetical protein
VSHKYEDENRGFDTEWAEERISGEESDKIFCS